MNDTPPTEPSPDAPTPSESDPVTPDELMNDFRGKPLGKILVFTVVLHLVLIVGLSPGYFMRLAFGEPQPPTAEEKRKVAVIEANQALREIADRYKLNRDELSEALSKPAATSDTGDEPTAETGDEPADTSEPTDPPADAAEGDDPDQPLSDIEETLQQEEAGPALPDLNQTPEEDLFGTQ